VRPPRLLPRLGGAPWPQAWISSSAGTQPASSSAEMTGPPRFLGRSSWTCAVLFDPARAPVAWPMRRPECCRPVSLPGRPQKKQFFRGSFARPQPSLSTLRRRPYGLPTQDSLAAGGLPLPRRFRTCRISFERVPLCHVLSTSLPPSPGFAWRTMNILSPNCGHAFMLPSSSLSTVSLARVL